MNERIELLIKKAGVVMVVLTMLTSVMPLFLTENARAADDDQFLWGMIFDSDDNLLSYDTDFRVWVFHNGTWRGFPSNTTWDPVGTMGGFYSYTLPWDQKETNTTEGNWTEGDPYRIQIDCTPSGDLAENATSNGTGSIDDPIPPRGSYNNIVNWLTGGGKNNSQQWDVVCSNVDLVPTTIEVNGQPYLPPMDVSPFSTVTFSANITNLGKTDIAEPNNIVLRNQSGVIDQDTAVFVNSSTSVGPFSLVWNAPEGGYFCFNITVDYDNNVSEIDETNNDAMVCLYVGVADLTPTDVGIATNYGTQSYDDVSLTNYRSNQIQITPGTAATIAANVTNVGTLSSGANDFAFYNTTGEGGPILGVPFSVPMVGPLNPGQSDGPSIVNWMAPAISGDYYVNITADYSDDVVEFSELNNTFILRFLVGYPDYIPWNDTLPLSQDVTSNTSIPLEVLVRNAGRLDALVNSTIAFYNQSDRSNPFATSSVLAIQAGQDSAQAYGAIWKAPSVVSMTTYYVVIEVDYDFDIAEENELNNTLVIEFNVYPGPATTLAYGTPNYVNGTTLYIASSTPLDLDVQSSITAYTHYSLDGGAWVNYSADGQFTISAEGQHNLDFYSFDILGNDEPINSQLIVVDDSPPITNLNVTEPKYVDLASGNMWIKSVSPATPVFLEWDRDDEPVLAVGRDLTSYRVYNQAWGLWMDYVEGNTLNLGTGDGVRHIEWFSLDLLGNNETTKTFTLYVDDTPPDTSSIIGDPNFEREQTIYVETKTEFTFSADDGSGCGVSLIEYRLDNDPTWTQYSEPFKIDEFGEHTIYYRGIDNLGNSFDDSQEVFVIGMNWKPIIAIMFIVIMIIVGAAVGYKRPLLMARKTQREIEDALLKEEEEMEKAGEDIGEGEHEEVMGEEPANEEVV